MGSEESEDEYLTLEDAARFLHVSPRTITRWADLGLLAATTAPEGHRCFQRGALDAVRVEMEGEQGERGKVDGLEGPANGA
jgi:hypothetical protein